MTAAASNVFRILESSAAVNEPCETAGRSAEVAFMRKLATGDEAAMKELIDLYGTRLRQLVSRLTGWSDEQDDILQDVLVAIWQRANSYHGDGSLEGWLRAIAVNRCRNHFRARDTFRRMLNLFGSRDALRESSENEDLVKFEESEQMRVALQKLNAKDRSLLVLFYLEEMPGEEIAQLTSTRVDTVHVQLHRARKRLCVILENIK